MPIYKNSRRPQWLISFGLFLYDQLAGSSILPKAKRISSRELLSRDPSLNSDGLLCGYEFSDGQMDDHALGLWVAEQAKQAGATIVEKTEVTALNNDGSITIQSEHRCSHDRVINIAGPWAEQLLQRSEIESPLKLDPVRGSHLILDAPCSQAYLLEVPDERRIFFSLPWQGKTLVGTTEVRQDLGDSIACSSEEKSYLMGAWKHYFPSSTARIVETFSGVRPLLRSSRDPGKATREYAIHRTDKLITVLGGKWTTALALANKVTQAIY
jgi:glycerol-3-phosphate dehydrogenase